MSLVIREGLNSTGMRLPLFTGGQSFAGFGIAGTWAGTLSFQFSTDGVNFNALSVQPFASGTTIQSTTANGNWFVPVQNFVAVQVVATALTSGVAVVTIATAIDSSWQDAFLAATSIFVNQSSTANAANAVTIAAQTNRAWRLRSLVISVSATATWGASPALTVSDGSSSILFAIDPPTTTGTYEVPLPADNGTPGTPGKGLVNTPGNSMVITLAAAGGTAKTNVNAEMRAA